ncbi:hypothetical protein AVEN_26028-1 [Araneus ventricosus]|uniref:Uncharacterized protein n=1 Tax=Araneus ventricosus TaxID=182803 RepID=A0A4Y2E681_ARAVE|nr:hypothetical protein AVEN_26028-1 [Araneus ventricosus]
MKLGLTEKLRGLVRTYPSGACGPRKALLSPFAGPFERVKPGGHCILQLLITSKTFTAQKFFQLKEEMEIARSKVRTIGWIIKNFPSVLEVMKSWRMQ